MPAATINRPPPVVHNSTGALPDAAPELARDARTGSFVRSLAAAFVGFVSGAAVWHFVGFWGFVSTVVLHGPHQTNHTSAVVPSLFADLSSGSTSSRPHTQPARVASAPASPAEPGERQALTVDDNCSALELRRMTSEIITTGCRGNSPVAIQALGRGDRAIVSVNPDWIVQVDAQSDLTR
jgi:hypothetical protein